MSSHIADEAETNKSIQNWIAGLSIISFEKKENAWEETIEKQVDENVLIGRWGEQE